MRKYWRLWLGLTLGHLFLVVLGAASVDLYRLGPLGRFLNDYSDLSGADSGYRFFAPNIYGNAVATFSIKDRQGHVLPASIETGSSHEADLNAAHLAGKVGPDNPERRRLLAGSLARKLFARHPEALEVLVRFEYFETVSMDEFKSGARPQRTLDYEASFARDGGMLREEVENGTSGG
jgi:hypothetical protein